MRKDEEKAAKKAAREEKRAEKRKRAMERHIVSCPHCGKEVLDHMTECPFCHGQLTPLGYGGRDEKKFKIARIVTYSVLFAIAIAVVVVMFVVAN